jgi:CRISPR-associated protein Csd2
MTEIKNRYDFVLIFDVQDGNPNGDPDAGNLPRIDPETGHGIVTDVCLKRKVRNYVQLKENLKKGYDIYIKEKAVLGRAHVAAFKELSIDTGQEARKSVPNSMVAAIQELDLPDGITFEPGDEEALGEIVVAPDADKKEINVWLKDAKPSTEISRFIKDVLKEAKPRKPTAEETEKGRAKMCEKFYDIRTFGAVMSLKSAPNCGQVRGPVQMTFGRSVDPIVTLEHSITRMAVATEAEAEKQSGDNRTMGRKNTVPYGLYVAHGFVSAHLAEKIKFSMEDMDLLWEALCNMFDHDRSAARGLMSSRKLVIFEHDSALGNAPAHKLFETVKIFPYTNKEKPARSFDDYKGNIESPKDGPLKGFPGITVINKL